MTRNLFLASLLMATAAATICRAATQAPTAIVEDIARRFWAADLSRAPQQRVA